MLELSVLFYCFINVLDLWVAQCKRLSVVTPSGSRAPSVLLSFKKSRDGIPKRQALNRCKTSACRLSNHLFSVPSCRFDVVDSLRWMWSGRVLVLAHERIRVVLLLEVAQGMVDFPMFGFVCPNVQQ